MEYSYKRKISTSYYSKDEIEKMNEKDAEKLLTRRQVAIAS